MTSYNTYPPIPWGPETPGPEGPSAPLEAPPYVGYHLNVVQGKRRGLINKEKMFKKKYKKYHRILNQLMWLYAC